MNFRIISKYILIITFAALAASCSTTRNLAEDEVLYTGIAGISYDGIPEKYKRSRVDTTEGVITSIANAAEAVADAISGNGTERLKNLASASKSEPSCSAAAMPDKLVARIEAQAVATAKEEAEAVLAYAPNNALFGSSSIRSPLPTGLWIYNSFVGAKGGLGKWIFKHFAATPIYVSTVSPEMRARVAANTLRNYGFFSASVSQSVVPQKNPKKAKIAYGVRLGPLHRLDSIEYRGFRGPSDSLLRATEHERILKSGDAFSVVNLSNEQSRIEELLRENGYYYFSSQHVAYKADTLQRDGFVQLRVQPAADIPGRATHPWYIGHTYISARRTEHDVLDQTRTRRNFTYTYSGEKLPLRGGMWRRAVSHRKGEPFRLSDANATLEKLGALSIFSQTDVSYVPRDTTALCDTLDVYISTLLDKLYDSSFEMNATLKSNQQIGPGVSYAIAKRNAFGGGEKVSFKIFGSYEWQMHAQSGNQSSLLNSYELGTELSFEFPRFIFPGMNQRRFRRPATTAFTLSADWKNRARFFQMLTFSAGMTYEWQQRSNIRHELTPLSLSFDKLLSKTATFDSIMTANPALYVSMRDQFVPAASYTFTYTSAASHRNPLWLQFHIKEAGAVTSGIFAAAGKRFNERDKELFGSPFAQFVKLTAEAHESIRLSPRFALATRLFAGAIFSYGNSERAPYADQFYVGGANSIRAFTVRTIGPGKYRAADSRYSYIDQTGDFKLEANAELRAHLFGSLYGAIFLDAGNVWLLRSDASRPGSKLSASTLKNIAVGTGWGFRYDLEFLVLRLDFGVGLHAPYETSKSGFYNIERFKDAFAFHFAIGYPF